MHLELEAVCRSYPEFALEVGFSVGRGEFYAILGPSGSGKTTLLRLIAGFDRPQAGRIMLAGEDITRLPPHKRRVGMVFQDYALFPHLSVGDNVAYGLKIKGTPAGERRRKVEELLHLTGLDGFYGREPSSLSGGERQRVAVARALAPEPLVLLFDEPFSALDLSLRKRLRCEIKELQRQTGFTALFVTHSQEEAFFLADRMLVMNDGRVEQVGRPEEIYRRPASPYVASFLGESNRLPVTVAPDGVSFTFDGAVMAVPAGASWPAGAGAVLLRPEDCRVRPGPSGGAGAEATVVAREFGGSTVTVRVRGRGGWEASALHLGSDAPEVEPGDRVWLELRLERAVWERS